MSKGLHVGCLCLIIRSGFPENIGREAEVVEHDPQDEKGLCWKISPTSGEPFTGSSRLRGTRPVMEVWAKSIYLLPITPDESITQETDREVAV